MEVKDVVMKTCPRCGSEKNVRMFSSRGKSGFLHSWCKDCEAEWRRENYRTSENQRRKESKRKRIYNALNPEMNNRTRVFVKKGSKPSTIQKKLVESAKKSYWKNGGVYKDAPSEYIETWLLLAKLKRVSKVIKEAKNG